MCLALAAVLFIGIVIFAWRYVVNGSDWASFYGNQQIYTNGEINRGTIYDRNDMMLMQCTPDGIVYNDDPTIRIATVHAVGDPKGNISTGAINMWKSELIGYDLVNGTYDTTADGKKIKLTIDANANAAAYNALAGREGTVGVFNYETGEILCMVSTPAFDPLGYIPDDGESSVFFNTFLQGTLTPGSTFKLVTSAAAIEQLDMDSFTYDCSGSEEVGGDTIQCTAAHGYEDFDGALANSCNCAFGEISREVGATDLAIYTENAGLTDTLNVDGINIAKGSFTFPEGDDVSLSWAGIGQYEDLVNPCALMVYVGAIANGGEAVEPSLIKSSNILTLGGGRSLGEYLDNDTADQLRSMMKNNVVSNYGEENFPGLDIYAKSGTAESGGEDNSWFTGFIDNEDHPYAFVVWVKGGGYGSQTAGPIANAVLSELVNS